MSRPSFTPADYFHATLLQCYPRWVEYKYAAQPKVQRRSYHEAGEIDCASLTWIGITAWISASERIEEIRQASYGTGRKPSNVELDEGTELKALREILRDPKEPNAKASTAVFAEQNAAKLFPAVDVVNGLGSKTAWYRFAPLKQIERWRDECSGYLKPFMALTGTRFCDFFDSAKRAALTSRYVAGTEK